MISWALWMRLAPLVLLAAALGMPVVAWAQQAELIVITRELEQGEIGAVRVRVRGERPTAPPRITVQPSSGLNLTFQGQRQQVNIVNGRVSKSFEYTYGIEALTPGTYTLGPAKVEIGTRKITTASASVSVRPRVGAQTEDLQARAGFDAETAYVGQVVLYRRTIRSRARILRDGWTDPPLDGLVPPRDGEPIYSEYALPGADGTTYVKEEYHPKIVMQSGVREVPAAVARVTVAAQGGRRSPLVRGPSRTRVLPVPSSTLTVLELPPQPPGFSGLVGDFVVEGSLDRREAAVGDSINLTVFVRGDGTLERFTLPRSIDDPSVRVYDGTPATAARVDGDGYKAEGRYSRVLVPTRPGQITLPPLKLVAFSPSRGEYVTHEIPLGTLNIRRGKAGGSVFESYVDDTDGDSVSLVQEIPYEGVREVRASGWASTWWIGAWMPWTLGLAGLPLVALSLIEVLLLGRRAAAGALTKLNTRRERELTPRQRLSRLPQDPAARLAELDAALRHALARKAGISVDELDREQALSSLDPELANRVRAITQRLDRMRFGGAGGAPDSALEADVAQIVRTLEGA